MKYSYNEKNLISEIENALGNKTKLSYDVLNRVVKAEMPDGNTIHLRYNAYDEVLTAKDNQQTVNFEYTWSGKLKKRQELNRTLEFVYHTEEQLKTIINEKGEKYLFDHDGNGLMSKVIRPDRKEVASNMTDLEEELKKALMEKEESFCGTATLYYMNGTK